ncbi:insulinase family protein [Helicobacter jaachi]|uniref:Insulinase family protein n=2 Tax=Helicobacter jaachi TaxID=1677920 RepID=A0A4U8T9B9_9HELI|nr:insulinase family protein [Helicobacter jaachi]
MSAQDSIKEGAKLTSIEIRGVQVPFIFEQSKQLPVGSIEFIFVGGASDEQKDGLAALSSKILNEGTKQLGNVEFAKKLESKAISIYAGANLQTMSFEISYLKEFEDLSFEFFKDLLYNPNLTPNALNKVKMLTLNRLAREEDDFDSVASKNLYQILFKGTRMAIPLLGTKQSIESIELKDIEAFLKRNLVLSRLIVVAGGDVKEEALRQKIISTFSALPVGEGRQREYYKTSREVDSINVDKPTEQAFIYFGAPFDINNKEQNYIARVMSFILGGSGFGSRIMEEVRVKRGLAYSAYTRINLDGSADFMSGYLQTKLENKDEAIKVVKEVIRDFVDNGVNAQELSAAKAFLLGSEPLREETLSQRLNATFSNYFKGLPLNQHKKELELIRNLSLEELNAYIKAHREILDLSFSVVE